MRAREVADRLGIDLAARQVLVAGCGISGRALVEPLRDLGASPIVTDNNTATLEAAGSALGVGCRTVEELGAPGALDRFALVIASPGWQPSEPILAAAVAEGIPVWGDVEFSWRVDQSQLYGPTRSWLVVTGTNGKTTTTAMLAEILAAAEVPGGACGNIGRPVLDALRDPDVADVLAVELSSFQLHWAPSVRPHAGAVLNIAEDHLDWHGGMSAYVAAKARALTGRVAVVGLDDPVAATLARRPRRGRTVGFRLGVPADGELGVVDRKLLDRAFTQAAILAEVADISPAGPAGVLDALAAGALARAYGVAPNFVRDGLRAHRVGPHRTALVRELGEVVFIDDSKATNPHAARISILAHERVVWLAGGLLKGANVTELVDEVADRLAAAVLIGRDAAEIADALVRHAPDVPVVVVPTRDDDAVLYSATGLHSATGAQSPAAGGDSPADEVMRRAVRTAAGLARPGDAVLLAPAAASLDMFRDYQHRGTSFADAVNALAEADIGAAR
jgi:UDP-N-acetylmuramoylalanine--D-glutamate ligase